MGFFFQLNIFTEFIILDFYLDLNVYYILEKMYAFMFNSLSLLNNTNT